MIFLKGNGIVIAKKDVEEADRYITVFMEDFGKISTLIKGIRKSKRRDKTAVDLLSLTNFSFYRKGEVIIISEFNSLETYAGIKEDIEKINIALYLFSALNQVLVENGRNRKIYALLEKSLKVLDKSTDKRKNLLVAMYFLYELIKDEGLIPEDEEDITFFLEQGSSTISYKEVEILKELLKNNVKKIIEDEEIKIENIRKVIIILEKYFNFYLETKIDSKRFLWGELLW